MFSTKLNFYIGELKKLKKKRNNTKDNDFTSLCLIETKRQNILLEILFYMSE